MTAMPPDRGPDPLGELADWIAEKLPQLTRGTGDALARFASAVNKVADDLSGLLRTIRER